MSLSTHQQSGKEVESLSEIDRDRLWEINTEMASQALRVLALAYKTTAQADEDLYRSI